MKIWWWGWLLIPWMASGQVEDTFTDGDFFQNPSWYGDTGHFEVTPDKKLHLCGSGSDTSLLMTGSRLWTETEWSFWIKLSFNTSLNNYTRVYLAADTPGLNSATALYLQIGGSDDSLTIISREIGLLHTIFRFKSYRSNHSVNLLRFRIIHERNGEWDVFVDTTGNEQYYREGSFYYQTSMDSHWFGIWCRYTSSNASKCWFDDFYVGPVRRDTIPPQVTLAEIISDSSIRIGFSEIPEKKDAENPGNYRLLSRGNPRNATTDSTSANAVTLTWSSLMPQGVPDTLEIKGITDLSGNMIHDTLLQVVSYRPEAFDVLITEIMANPEPSQGLPSEEFVELLNRSPFPVNLKGWILKYGNYSKVFPGQILPAGGYLIVSKTLTWQPYGNCLPLFTSSTSLANDGTTLVLKDPEQHVIHSVHYCIDWFRNSYKKEGGWSLEMIDPANPCECGANWIPSVDPAGGTPGKANSVKGLLPDESDPRLLYAFPEDTARIRVYFNEPMDSVTQGGTALFAVMPQVENITITGIIRAPPDYRSLILLAETPLRTGVHYRLGITGKVTDCTGNIADTTHWVWFAIPGFPVQGDLVVNEILFDPRGDGSRFIEVYNRSDKVLDFHDIILAASKTPEITEPGAFTQVSGNRLIFPGDYFALAHDPDDLKARYRIFYPDLVLEMDNFPSVGNDSGYIALLSRGREETIDKIRYSETMHYPLLSSNEGVSLERVHPDVPSDYSDNWKSAAQTAGFATPGYRNSQWHGHLGSTVNLSLEPEVFSPDNDGLDDLLGIRIREDEPGFSVTINIFDHRGQLMRSLVSHAYAGNEALFFWDGINSAGQKAPVGLYVIAVELFRPDGRVKRAKAVAALATLH